MSTCPPFDPSAAPGGGDGSVTLESLGGVFQVLVLFQVAVLSMYIFVRSWPEWLSNRIWSARASLFLPKVSKDNFHFSTNTDTKTLERLNPMMLSDSRTRSTVRDVLGPRAKAKGHH